MSTLQIPSTDHEQFDAICSEVADFEPLPTVVVEPAAEEPTPETEEDQPLDGLILAGLVTPY